jgi:hypothetical protein
MAGPIEQVRWPRSSLAETDANDHASAACYRGRNAAVKRVGPAGGMVGAPTSDQTVFAKLKMAISKRSG